MSATEDGTYGASVSETAYPSATLQRPSNKSRAGYTPPPSNASCRSQRSHAKLRGYALEKSSPSSQKTLTSCESTTGSTSLLPQETATTKLQVAARTSAVTVLEPSCRLSPTVLVQTPTDPHKVATALQLLAAIVRSSLTATLAVAAATAEAPTMGPTGGPMAEAVAEVETTRTSTPPEPHRAATTPARRLKNCGGRSPPPQATTTASPPSLLGFATYSSWTSSNLWESPSTTRSRIPSSGSGATPSPSRTLEATTTLSASTSPSAWTKPRSHGSSRWTSTQSTSGTS
jgi:hypothetical protein